MIVRLLRTKAANSVVKLIYCFRRRAGMSDDAFARYWAEVHGALGARIPELRRLVQSRAIRVPGDARNPDFDGVAELWFDDAAALLRARASDEWRNAGLDEVNFIDGASTAYLVADERTIFEAMPPNAEA